MIGISVAVGEFLVGLLWAAATVGGGILAAALGVAALGAGVARRAWKRRQS